jgi:RimJ/RimL family protein N-acetyltransferase
VRAPELVTLTRGRVRLEPLGPQHDGDLLEAAQDDDVWRWMPILRPRSLGDVERLREVQSAHAWAVIVDGRACGTTSYLDVDTELGGLEIGWTWYARALWATDVNPTCKLLLLSYAFEELGAGRVTLRTDGLNSRSQAAIKKLGFLYDGTLRHHRLRPAGTVRNTAFFSMLADEWPAAKARLVQRADI